MKISSLTDIGVRRKENQDNFWSARLDVDGAEGGVVCLCDGMGGLADGELASRMVVGAVRDYIKTSLNINGLKEVIQNVNKSIFDIGIDKKLGTTCTVLFCINGKYNILHVGDSRCYKISNGVKTLLTTDHSAINKYKDYFENNPDKIDPAKLRKLRNTLTRCIGVGEYVDLDEEEGIYEEGDTFVVCSDGLWHYFEKQEEVDLDNLEGLIQNCISDGETDNITIAVLKI